MKVNVTASDGGHSPKTWGRIAARRIVEIADTAPPVIRDQAQAFRHRVEQVVAGVAATAKEEERGRIARTLESNGHAEIAALIRKV